MLKTVIKAFIVLTVFLFAAGGIGFAYRSEIINLMMPADSRPYKISYDDKPVAQAEIDKLAGELKTAFKKDFNHIERFKKAGIKVYEGPKTCLACHAKMTVHDPEAKMTKEVGLMDNLLTSAHYRFYTEKHPNVYGFNGKLADNFPMGKIDRPCPKPGSFAMTSWAAVFKTKNGKTYSEGCGQCHIGGQYQSPLGEIMPMYQTLAEEKDAIDCLICHSAAYDMNKKQAVVDNNGLARWEMDRSMKAAVSVTKTTAQTCLRCHQHNLGGDLYVDPKDNSFMQSMTNKGKERPRIAHPGSKRGTPFSPSWDVHAAKGLACTACHETMGHHIAKGTHTTTMMANDLPNTEVVCEKCHTDKPHKADPARAPFFNMHTAKIACVTCHIPSLHEDNATYRDFTKVSREEEADLYVYTDVKKETQPGIGIKYAWWNGDATFLGNPIGDNPNGKNLYSFYKPQHIWPEYKNFDYAGWYERVMRPIAKAGRPSKIYAMKPYNGKQHIDLQNMGPFGGMFVPYNLPTYLSTGDPGAAAKKEMKSGMMGMMYGFMFKYYLMDKFMAYMDVPSWNTGAYADASELKKVEPRYIPNDAMLEISHAIRRDGALSCKNCHNASGVMDFKELGYPDDVAARLKINPLGDK